MAKAMTCKEFWQVLESVGITKEIWGYDGILNMISILESSQAEQCEKMGLKAAADGNKKRSDAIFKVLTDRGYYDK